MQISQISVIFSAVSTIINTCDGSFFDVLASCFWTLRKSYYCLPHDVAIASILNVADIPAISISHHRHQCCCYSVFAVADNPAFAGYPCCLRSLSVVCCHCVPVAKNFLGSHLLFLSCPSCSVKLYFSMRPCCPWCFSVVYLFFCCCLFCLLVSLLLLMSLLLLASLHLLACIPPMPFSLHAL